MTAKPAYNMKFMWMICLIAAMGGFLFGYDFLVVGGAQTFWRCGGICAAGFLFVLLMIPKTEGKSLEQIERELVDCRSA